MRLTSTEKGTENAPRFFQLSHLSENPTGHKTTHKALFHKKSITSTSVLKLRVKKLDPRKNESHAQANPETFKWKWTAVLPSRMIQADLNQVQSERRVQLKPLGWGWKYLSSCCLRGRLVIPTLSVHVCVCLAPTTLTIPCHIQKQKRFTLRQWGPSGCVKLY